MTDLLNRILASAGSPLTLSPADTRQLAAFVVMARAGVDRAHRAEQRVIELEEGELPPSPPLASFSGEP